MDIARKVHFISGQRSDWQRSILYMKSSIRIKSDTVVSGILSINRNAQSCSLLVLSSASNATLYICGAEPESFVSGDLVRVFLRQAIIQLSGPSSAHQRNAIWWRFAGWPMMAKTIGISQAVRWWPIIKCWLGSFVVFEGVRTSIPEETHSF